MRKVAPDPENHSGIDSHAWRDWKKNAAKSQKELLDWFESTNSSTTPAVPEPKEKEHIWRELKTLIIKPVFHSKCAYCEIPIVPRLHAGDADHYRPKNPPKTANPAQVRPLVGVGPEEHLGYPWLRYDWQNLIPTCSTCNNRKLSQFPIAGTRCIKPEPNRLTTPELNAHEQPLLLHPYFDDPAKHLKVDEAGQIYAPNQDPRGQATIDICHLDDPDLDTARHQAQLNAWKQVKDLEKNSDMRLLVAIRKLLEDAENGAFSMAVRDYFLVRLAEEITALEQLIATEKARPA